MRWLFGVRGGGAISLAAILLVLLPMGSGAQSSLPCSANCTLSRSQPFSVAYDWAPTTIDPPSGFRLYQNGVIVATAAPAAWQSGVIAFGFPSGIATPGAYSLAISVFSPQGETRGDPIAVTILKGRPFKPASEVLR